MSAASFSLPAGYDRIKFVESFEELVSTPLQGRINALCWRRELPGDFQEIVELLNAGEGITDLDEPALNSLVLSAAGATARSVLQRDYELLRDHGLQPSLNCIKDYPRDEEPDVVPIHVYSFHADSATVPTDTYLCSYNEPTSEGLRNEDAQRRVDLPQTRSELLELFGGPEGEEFNEFLRENCFDLHYAAIAGATPFPFGVGNLWRIACDWPGSPVPPCIHRAPETSPGERPRLLLIS